MTNIKYRLKALLSLFAILPLFTILISTNVLATVTPTPSGLFISEYIEGSSFNKAIEIYNGTGTSIDLGAGGYNIKMYFNGNSSAGYTVNLTGTIANNDVFVLAESSANASILAKANQTDANTSWYNGNDAVALYKGFTSVDVVGQIGFNPGTEWGSGMTSTADNTLLRKCSVTQGDSIGNDSFDPSIEWVGYATDTSTNLGALDCSKPYYSLIPDITSYDENGYININPHVETRIKSDLSNMYMCQYGIKENGALDYTWATPIYYGIADNEMYCNFDVAGLGNGKNYDIAIRGQDTAGYWSDIYVFNRTIDNTSPVTTASATNTDSTIYNFNTWTVQDVIVTLNATDAGGGVDDDAPDYCIDQTNTCDPSTIIGIEYQKPFIVSTEGVNYVRFYSWDSLGNHETVKTAIVKIDKTKPSLSLKGNNPLIIYQNGHYSESGYDYSDNISVAGLSISGNVNTSTIGTYLLTYTVTDQAGNSTSQTRTVNVVAIPFSNINNIFAGLTSKPAIGAGTVLGNSDNNKNDPGNNQNQQNNGNNNWWLWLIISVIGVSGLWWFYHLKRKSS